MVLLRVQPRSGDTLRLQMGGYRLATIHLDRGTGDCCIAMGGSFNSSRRLIAIQQDSNGAVLEGMVDTMDWTWRGKRAPIVGEIKSGLPISLGTIRLYPDGSAQIFGTPDFSDSVEFLAISSEAMLPAHRVHPGSVWEAHGLSYARADPFRDRRRATRIMIRLDSLSPRLDRAYMSYTGTAAGDSAPAPILSGLVPEFPGATYLVTGTLSGTLILDRERGYWSRIESKIVIRADAVLRSDPTTPVRVGGSEVFVEYETASASVLVKK
jgi:hypothetical protein